MAKEPIGLLSTATIGRTRIARVDAETGLPMEEAVPSLGGGGAKGGVYMYDKDGSRLWISTHCHRPFVQAHDDKYKPRIIRDLLLEGYLQEGYCPHAMRDSIERASVPLSAKDAKDYKPCDGKGDLDEATFVGGCAHMKKLVGARRKIAAAAATKRKNPAARAASFALAQELAKQSAAESAAVAQRAKVDTGGVAATAGA